MTTEPVLFKKIHSILSHSPVVFYISRLRGNKHAAQWVSPNIQVLLGYQQEEALRTSWWLENLHPHDRERIEAKLTKISSIKKELVLEYRFKHKENGYLWIRDIVRIEPDPKGDTIVYGIWEDITTERNNLDKIINLQRAIGMLTKTNQLLIQRKDLQQLYKDICDIAVNDGGFRLAWLGFLDKDTGKIVPVARAGVDLGYVDQVQATLNGGNPRSYGPAARAIRENKVIVIKDTESDSNFELWRDRALKRGFRSVIGLPVNAGNNDSASGVLTLYSNEPNYFNDEEINLLNELANDLSVGIKNIENENNLYKAREQLRHIAFYDGLTQLPNYNFLLEQMGAVLSDNHKSALIILQIDGFNEINHVLGYTRGDEMLMQISERIRESLWTGQIVARVAGTKFSILLPEFTSTEQVLLLVKRLHERVREPMLVKGIPIELRSHAGIAFSPEHSKTAGTLFRAADMARVMSGRNRQPYLIYDPDMETDPHKLGLAAELRRAIENQELVLYYQPKIDLHGRCVIGAEALVRWQHPKRGIIPPMDFVTVAENTGIITNITYYVLANAMRDFLELHGHSADMSIAVNISGRDLEHNDFINNFENLLEQYPINPVSLVLELTETAMMSDISRCDEILQQIQKFGVRIAVDDFGTGYSSLSYLADLPLNSLKIDRTFVMDMYTNDKCHSIVRSTIDMAKNLNLGTTAEGIEDPDMINVLAGMGCSEGQGFGISRPMPFTDLRQWLQDTDFRIH